MFCGYCGQQAEDGMLFCTNCGAKIELPAVETAPVVTAPEAVAEETPSPKKAPWLPWAIGGAVLIVAAVVLWCGVFSGTARAKACAKGYLQALFECDYAAAADCYLYDNEMMIDARLAYYDETFEEYYEYLAEDYGPIRNIEDLYEAQGENQKVYLEDMYGDDLTCRMTVGGINKLTDDEIDLLIDDIEDTIEYYEADPDDFFNADKIGDGYVVWMVLTVEGDDDTATECGEVYVVQYGSQWRVLV